jgi:hypothetical protein
MHPNALLALQNFIMQKVGLTEPWDFIKSSTLHLSVHMELSLCLSFYLKRSLGGYTVGTTAGFPVKIMEALAPQSHH